MLKWKDKILGRHKIQSKDHNLKLILCRTNNLQIPQWHRFNNNLSYTHSKLLPGLPEKYHQLDHKVVHVCRLQDDIINTPTADKVDQDLEGVYHSQIMKYLMFLLSLSETDINSHQRGDNKSNLLDKIILMIKKIQILILFVPSSNWQIASKLLRRILNSIKDSILNLIKIIRLPKHVKDRFLKLVYRDKKNWKLWDRNWQKMQQELKKLRPLWKKMQERGEWRNKRNYLKTSDKVT